MQVEDAVTKLRQAADLAAARGSLLFHLDLATAVAEAALASQNTTYLGLAALVDDQGYRVIALDGLSSVEPVAEVRYDERGKPQVHPGSETPPRAAAFASARELIRTTRIDDETEYVAVVIPADDPRKPLQGYAIAIAASSDYASLGPHWLVALDKAGRKITARTTLPVGGSSAILAVHLLADQTLVTDEAVPNEIHTYLSLKHSARLRVNTTGSGLSWRIDGERTDLLDSVPS